MGNTLQEITTALQNPTHTVYLYIGAEIDPGWTIAKTSCGLAANALPLRVDDFTVVKSILAPGAYCAVCFDWNGAPKCYLTAVDVTDLDTVLGKLAEAQGC